MWMNTKTSRASGRGSHRRPPSAFKCRVGVASRATLLWETCFPTRLAVLWNGEIACARTDCLDSIPTPPSFSFLEPVSTLVTGGMPALLSWLKPEMAPQIYSAATWGAGVENSEEPAPPKPGFNAKPSGLTKSRAALSWLLEPPSWL
jgi:hypothetical protein